MKNIKFNKSNLLAIIGSILIFSACSESSFLDTPNPNNPNDEIFWTVESNAKSAIASIYSPIRKQMYGPYSAMTGYQIQNVRADDTWAILGEDPEIWPIVNFSNTADNSYSDYKELYESINRANVFLAKISSTPMDGELKKQWISEVKFLRAFNYFYLVREYNEVPLRLISPSADSSEKFKASATNEQLWAQIEQDLKEAIEYLPLPVDRKDGRASRGAAIALLGKSYIYQGKYKEGAEQLAIIKKSPYTYELVDNPDDNFSEFTELNVESVFELVYDGVGGDDTWGSENDKATLGCVLPQFFGSEGTGGWFKIMPSAAIVEAFLKEERPAGSNTKFDKRLYTSCYFKHSDYGDVAADEKWYGEMSFDNMWTACSDKRLKGQPIYPAGTNGKEGRFLMKKFTNAHLKYADANNYANPANQNNNVRVMRFAEILLLDAEACIKTGNLGEAANDLNRIRTRAGLPQKTWAGADQLWEEMEHQKFLELYFENQRWYDLKRWYSVDKVREILTNNKKQGAANLKDKHVFLPIPQLELNTNTAIQQNTPWR